MLANGKQCSSPQFIATLRSQTVFEKSDVQLSCTVSGFPEPVVTWYKNGRTLTDLGGCAQCETLMDGYIHTLHLSKCAEKDAAVYQVSAQNTQGIISCSAVLEVGNFKRMHIFKTLFQHTQSNNNPPLEPGINTKDKPSMKTEKESREDSDKEGSSIAAFTNRLSQMSLNEEQPLDEPNIYADIVKRTSTTSNSRDSVQEEELTTALQISRESSFRMNDQQASFSYLGKDGVICSSQLPEAKTYHKLEESDLAEPVATNETPVGCRKMADVNIGSQTEYHPETNSKNGLCVPTELAVSEHCVTDDDFRCDHPEDFECSDHMTEYANSVWQARLQGIELPTLKESDYPDDVLRLRKGHGVNSTEKPTQARVSNDSSDMEATNGLARDMLRAEETSVQEAPSKDCQPGKHADMVHIVTAHQEDLATIKTQELTAIAIKNKAEERNCLTEQKQEEMRGGLAETSMERERMDSTSNLKVYAKEVSLEIELVAKDKRGQEENLCHKEEEERVCSYSIKQDTEKMGHPDAFITKEKHISLTRGSEQSPGIAVQENDQLQQKGRASDCTSEWDERTLADKQAAPSEQHGADVSDATRPKTHHHKVSDSSDMHGDAHPVSHSEESTMESGEQTSFLTKNKIEQMIHRNSHSKEYKVSDQLQRLLDNLQQGKPEKTVVTNEPGTPTLDLRIDNKILITQKSDYDSDVNLQLTGSLDTEGPKKPWESLKDSDKFSKDHKQLCADTQVEDTTTHYGLFKPDTFYSKQDIIPKLESLYRNHSGCSSIKGEHFNKSSLYNDVNAQLSETSEEKTPRTTSAPLNEITAMKELKIDKNNDNIENEMLGDISQHFKAEKLRKTQRDPIKGLKNDQNLNCSPHTIQSQSNKRSSRNSSKQKGDLTFLPGLQFNTQETTKEEPQCSPPHKDLVQTEILKNIKHESMAVIQSASPNCCIKFTNPKCIYPPFSETSLGDTQMSTKDDHLSAYDKTSSCKKSQAVKCPNKTSYYFKDLGENKAAAELEPTIQSTKIGNSKFKVITMNIGNTNDKVSMQKETKSKHASRKSELQNPENDTKMTGVPVHLQEERPTSTSRKGTVHIKHPSSRSSSKESQPALAKPALEISQQKCQKLERQSSDFDSSCGTKKEQSLNKLTVGKVKSTAKSKVKLPKEFQESKVSPAKEAENVEQTGSKLKGQTVPSTQLHDKASASNCSVVKNANLVIDCAHSNDMGIPLRTQGKIMSEQEILHSVGEETPAVPKPHVLQGSEELAKHVRVPDDKTTAGLVDKKTQKKCVGGNEHIELKNKECQRAAGQTSHKKHHQDEMQTQKPPGNQEDKAPILLQNIHAETFANDSGNIKLCCTFSHICADSTIKWTKDSMILAKIQRKAGDESPVSLAIVQATAKDQGVYQCQLKNSCGKASSEFNLTTEALNNLIRQKNLEGGEEITFAQLMFREDFLNDQYFGDNKPGCIVTEEVHFGEGLHRKAFRTTVINGLVPVFNPGHPCVLKVHNAIAYGTKTNDELIQKNYRLAVQECHVQNTAREYIKEYRTEATNTDSFGEVPDIIPIYLIHRPANNIPYATLEEELIGEFVKYSVKDGKELNVMRRDSDAGQKCCTFQHWVFQRTGGNLLVTDMQGVGMKLTDVGIATCGKGYKGFKGNCATSFIDQFKVLHQCNKFCELMGLKPLLSSQPKTRKMAAAIVKTKVQPMPKNHFFPPLSKNKA
ncbi:alpha-protein kinase 2 [Erpetoichthys calabaricus]|uniref:alpha-protein kinase 2 n=1 Tax=Erpetoichthys calabaricus TaxID=27687 RepID=UPI00223465DD|nr:alpha-protein kinase 2 [Erpetoichthys calabaricus]